MNGDLLSLFVEHEMAVSELYEAYAEKFLSMKEFWATLSWEEQDHAKKIREFSEMVKKEFARFNSIKFNAVVIRSSLEYIAKELVKAKKGDIALVNALTVALSIEKAPIDGEIFESFTGFTAEAKKLVRELVASFDDHYQTIQTAWSEHRIFS